MARKFARFGTALLRCLFTGLSAVGLVSTSVTANSAPSVERLALESRVQAVRQALQDSASQVRQVGDEEPFSTQWGNWGNWGNWANAWNNWGNWGNWFNG